MKRSAFRRPLRYVTAFAACVTALSPGASAQTPSITYVLVNHPNATTTTAVNGINDLGEYVGIYDDANLNFHGFVGKKGSSHYTPIDFPGAAQTYIFRINNWDEIVGTYFDQAGYQHGFVRLPPLLFFLPPIYLPLDFPGSTKTQGIDYELGFGLGTSAFGLNDLGQITGQYADKNGVGHGFVLSLGGFTSYTVPGANNAPGFLGGSGLSDINDYGDVAGEYAGTNPLDPIFLHGFLLKNGKTTVIDPPGSILTQVFGVNDSREVSGFYYDGFPPPDGPGVGHSFIFSKGKFLIVDVPGAVYVSTVGTVNNVGNFVGEYTDGLGLTHGYIATRH